LCKKQDQSYVVVTRVTIDLNGDVYTWDDKEDVGDLNMVLRGLCFKEALENWWECKLKE
jgi:hypothetical protein